MPRKQGLLLINLGSPPEPTRGAVHRYLTQFLTDKYVIDLPWLWRQILVRGIIVPFRAGKSAHAYKSIWRPEGSPLTIYTRGFAERVAVEMGPEWEVRWAMRYGEPSVATTMKNWDVDSVKVIPLYPQYAESSTQTALDEVIALVPKTKTIYLQDFYERPEFLDAQAMIMQRHIDEFKPDGVLFSFHGLPEHHLNRLHPEHCHQNSNCCDHVGPANRLCYRAQCMATVRGLKDRLDFSRDKIHVGFQSRLGRRPWIKPYTDFVIGPLIKSGVRRLLVGCPSFVADCLETLEEIEMRLREQFIEEGGEELKLIPSLNLDANWVENFGRMVRAKDLPWQDFKS